MKKEVTWCSQVPGFCELCEQPIIDRFVDGSVPGIGSWAIMHDFCFTNRGGSFGTGRGQLYQRKNKMRWVKIEG